MRVAVVGNGYVGTTTATCLAWLGNDVVGLETNRVQAEQLAAGQLTFYEPGLSEMLTEALANGRLRFTPDPSVALPDAEIAFVCVGTPEGPDGRPDLEQVASASRAIAAHLSDGLVVVVKSTVPVGTADWVRKTILEGVEGRGRRFSVVSNPEFLREARAIEDFLRPDRIVLGGEQSAVDRVLELYRPILDQSFAGAQATRPPDVFVTDLSSAEMVKYAANAFLATKISFANDIAALCELSGTDVRQVLPAVGADERIGRSFLLPGLGWGGSCLPKDVAGLMAMAADRGYRSPLLEAVVAINEGQRTSAITKLERELGPLEGKAIAILGLAFKPGTSDLRGAPALDVARRLSVVGAQVAAYDPAVKSLPEEFSTVRLAADAYDAVEGADAAVVATEWPEFAALDPAVLADRMRGTVLVDGRNALDPERVTAAGLRLVGVGWNP